MYSIKLSDGMIILTVFIQELRRTKHKASNQYVEENEYISKNNKFFPELALPTKSMA